MAEYTVTQLKDAAKAAYADGNEAAAKRLIDAARSLEAQESARLATPSGMAGDVAKAGGAGFARGATGAIDVAGEVAKTLDPATMPSQAMRFMQFLQDQGLGLPSWAGVGGKRVGIPQEGLPTLQQAAADVTGGATEYRGKTVPAQFAGTMGEFAGGAAALPVGATGSLAKYAGSLLGGAMTGAATETAGQTARVLAPQYEDAARLAASLAAPLAGAAITPMARRIALGPKEDIASRVSGSNLPESAALLRSKGIEVAPPQAIGSPKLTEITGMYEPTLSQKTQLTRAALREIGEAGDVLATPSVLASNRKRIGSVFDRVEKAGPVIAVEDDAMRALQAEETARNLLPSNAGGLSKSVTDLVDEFSTIAGAGEALSPQYLKQTKTKLAKMLPKFSKANQWADYNLAQDMIEVLDDTVQRNLARNAPELLPELTSARQQYRSLLTLERAVNRAGKDAAQGYITPNALASSVRAREGSALVRGSQTELGDLSQAAAAVLTPEPTTRAGGVRMNVDASGNVEKALGLIPRMAASSQMPTLEKSLSEAMFQRLLRGAAPRLGGISQIYGER